MQLNEGRIIPLNLKQIFGISKQNIDNKNCFKSQIRKMFLPILSESKFWLTLQKNYNLIISPKNHYATS